MADAVGASKEAIHSEIERIAQDKEREPVVEAVVEQKIGEEKVTTRTDDIIRYLLALQEVTKSEYPKLSARIEKELSDIISPESQKIFADPSNSVYSEIVFITEKHIDGIREKDLLEEVSDRLTELSHMIARKKLSVLRSDMLTAEKEDRSEDIEKLLKATKEAEIVLQRDILL